MPKATSNQMVSRRMGDVHLIEFTVSHLIDQAVIQVIGVQIEQLVVQSGRPKLIIDFSGLQSVSSAMVGVIISINKKVQSMKGELRLAAVGPSIMEVFELTHLDKILKIYRNFDQAMHRF